MQHKMKCSFNLKAKYWFSTNSYRFFYHVLATVNEKFQRNCMNYTNVIWYKRKGNNKSDVTFKLHGNTKVNYMIFNSK